MNIFNIIFFLILFIVILLYIKNEYLNENFSGIKHHSELKNPHNTNRKIDLASDKTIMKECKNDFCYYDLDKIMKVHKADNPHGSFDAKNNKGEVFIVSGGGVPLLLNKGLKLDIKVKNEKVNYIVSPL